MTVLFPRHRWLLATGAAACLALTACSGSAGSAAHPSAAATAASPTASAVPTAPVGTAEAAAALRRAVRVTASVRSYRFAAEQTVTGGPAPQVTRLTGRAIRPAALTYTLLSGGRTQQIVRVGGVTYRRVVPGRYKRLVKATPPVDPLHSLVGILNRVASVTSAPTAGGTDFTGSLSGQAAAAAGLVGNAKPAPGLTIPVKVRADRLGRITRLELTEPLQAGARRLLLRQVTTYGGFNAQPAIARPR
jgi:hypothetical protein